MELSFAGIGVGEAAIGSLSQEEQSAAARRGRMSWHDAKTEICLLACVRAIGYSFDYANEFALHVLSRHCARRKSLCERMESLPVRDWFQETPLDTLLRITMVVCSREKASLWLWSQNYLVGRPVGAKLLTSLYQSFLHGAAPGSDDTLTSLESGASGSRKNGTFDVGPCQRANLSSWTRPAAKWPGVDQTGCF